jgi:transcriptional regulator with XRE-family HTH domain
LGLLLPRSQHSEAARILGERFRDARIAAKVTRAELANLADMNVANYGKIERGRGNPNFDTIVRLAGVPGVDPARFVKGIGLDQLPPKKSSHTVAEFRRERDSRR